MIWSSASQTIYGFVVAVVVSFFKKNFQTIVVWYLVLSHMRSAQLTPPVTHRANFTTPNLIHTQLKDKSTADVLACCSILNLFGQFLSASSQFQHCLQTTLWIPTLTKFLSKTIFLRNLEQMIWWLHCFSSPLKPISTVLVLLFV